MKSTLRRISVILLVLCLFLITSPAYAVQIGESVGITEVGINRITVVRAVRNYMETREQFLLGKTNEMNWLVTGITNDEILHREQCTDSGISYHGFSFAIDTVACYDTMAIVTVLENVSYHVGGVNGTETVLHELTVMLHDGTEPIVAADEYKEVFSGFVSCSYVPDEGDATINNIPLPGGSSLCIVEVAKGEIGYSEADPDADTNITKYGTEMGYPGQAWCAVFVSWCAKHANVADTIIKRHADCDTIKNFFMDKGTFNYSSAQGGNYIPVAGDIVFKGVTIKDSTHVGIVEKVVGQYVYMIDGNGPGGVVARRTFKLTASNVLGYGHPSYSSTEHVAAEYSHTSENHTGTCANCGVTFEESHDMHNECIDSAKHKSVCSKCEYTGGTFNHIISAVLSSDSESHWYACGGCGYRAQEEAHTCGTYQSNSIEHWRVCSECGTICDNASHVFMTSTDGSKVCRICRYVGYSSVVVQREMETIN